MVKRQKTRTVTTAAEMNIDEATLYRKLESEPGSGQPYRSKVTEALCKAGRVFEVQGPITAEHVFPLIPGALGARAILNYGSDMIELFAGDNVREPLMNSIAERFGPGCEIRRESNLAGYGGYQFVGCVDGLDRKILINVLVPESDRFNPDMVAAIFLPDITAVASHDTGAMCHTPAVHCEIAAPGAHFLLISAPLEFVPTPPPSPEFQEIMRRMRELIVLMEKTIETKEGPR